MSLLFTFRPIVLNPRLAVRIGLNEAIVLQQLKYWLMETDSGVEHEGRRWIYNTLPQWQKQFPFWSEDTIKRALSSLKSQGVVIVKQIKKSTHDRTNFYAIDYESRCLIEEGNLHSSKSASCTAPSGQHALLSTETTTEITTEILPDVSSSENDRIEACRTIWRSYSAAYMNRYGTEPVRNAKVNGQINQLLKRLGAEASFVAAYYVGINDSFLIRSSHEFGMLLAKAEAYRTQWATNTQMTGATARQMENTQSNLSAAEEAKRMMREGGLQNAFLRR